ncbi:hypothetical protein HA402_003072 [Bradysia odoriphaga]|nr:hypothetical protein HA402_003072 [Bradysia odoriphaga]
MRSLVVVGFLASVLMTSSVSGNYDYAEVIEKSLLFYEAQRTGYLPPDNRIPWRGDSFVTDVGDDGEDLTGGYFSSEGFAKFQFPAASTMTFLAWGMYDSKEGYEKSGQWENALACLRWGMDYLIKTHPSPNVLYVQVGNGTENWNFWGRPEEWTGSNPRITLKATRDFPASEVAAEQAAAMSAAAMVFRDNGDREYANTLLTHAVQLYSFATRFRGHYNESFPEVAQFYNSWSGFADEFLWSAAWLFRATGKPFYRAQYNQWWTEFGLSWRPSQASWDLKLAQAQVLLARIDGSPQYVDAARTFCDWAANEAPKTPLGLFYAGDWGTNRYAANVVYVCLQAAQIGINAETYLEFADSQIGYMLGDTGRSFVVGFGNNPPVNPRHAASSCPDQPAPCDWNNYDTDEPNHQILFGALVGGPDRNDQYNDRRTEAQMNRVSIDYNSGFQSSVAELCALYCD